MRIALRTGGGRGVYELAGSQGTYRASDLFNREMFYELTPDLVVPGRAVPDVRQGKPRIKLNNQRNTTHFYRLLAGLLILPKPKREFRTTAGDTLIGFETYSMTAIKVDVGNVDVDKAVVRPTEILLENFQGLKKSLSFIDRMARVMEVWRVASEQDSPLASLLRAHKDALYAEDIDHKDVEKAAKEIFKYLDTIYDPLHRIESDLGISKITETEEGAPIDSTKDFGMKDAISPEAARIENIRRWRKIAVRGAEATKFRAEIKKIYRDTCLFTGQRLPKLDVISSAGVDAAHILPWARYGVNTVDNGICLSKQCHWAFDAGVVKLAFDRSRNQYVISIPDAVSTQSAQHNFSLDAYQAMVGPIPRERLPLKSDYWPNSSYLDAFNQAMFP